MLLHPYFATNKSVLLIWEICPTDSYIFNIERKEKTTSWEKIGEIKDTLNFEAKIINNVMNYYRIKAIINAKEFFSNTDSAYIGLERINNFQNIKSSLYPNPSKDYIYFKNSSINSFAIYNITGKLLLESNEISNSSEIKIDVHSLQSGLYFIVLKTERGLVTERFIKE